MSTLKVDTIQDTNAVEMYLCKAWVSFNGTGTVAIKESGNVSSITDNGTGYYTVNLTTAMPDANYCVVANDNYVGAVNHSTVFSTSSYTLISRDTTFTGLDCANVCSAVFR